ncbi:Non-structural maintenance of chromosomes element 1 [Gracilaria domingensis]|nr:Non-structural maintenance of chromosomes element 1 [Gracilaria domingensis]
MAAKALSQQKAIELYNACLAASKEKRGVKVRDVDAFHRRMDKINKSLAFFDMELKTIYSPYDQAQYWALVNTLEDETVESATTFKGINEKKMYFDIIGELMDDLQSDGEGMLPHTYVQNLATNHGMTIADGSQMLQRMNHLKWLKTVRGPSGETFVAPGPRSLLELPQLRTLIIKLNMKGVKKFGEDVTESASQQ